ncbi:MAG: radical SAM protein [Candidatus Omnitrophica bacterium]|nr:radical SAM protein [Candidatus Omnitrophota bacterium]MCM8824782.1 radical SAM protein [Candidatus Omnitrophota bacterium]
MHLTPSYKSLNPAQFQEKIEALESMLQECKLCPRKCKAKRESGEKGFCRAGANLWISSYGAHFGEEEILVGSYGSGTIFFTWCNLRCSFCQNYDISLEGNGESVSEQQCAEIMIYLQKRGCHNINLVTPTHYTPQIVKSIKIASEKGLNIPIVWNCGGYESFEVIRTLDKIVDIYMPDIKYSNSEAATLLSNAPDYFERCKEAIIEMYRQVGNIQIENNIAKRGLLIRHLVLPEDLAGSEQIFMFLKNEISPDVFINIMAQYRPYGNIPEKMGRRITINEYRNAIILARKIGLRNIIHSTTF